MTVAIAWVGEKPDQKALFLASDSRISAGERFDASPKILTLPRSDCALCFAGLAGTTYAFMIQIGYAIGAHGPSRDRSLDVCQLKEHLLQICNSLFGTIKGSPAPFTKKDAEFLVAGYSWKQKQFKIWTFYFSEKNKRFEARSTGEFHKYLNTVALIGDRAPDLRRELVLSLNKLGKPVYLEPLFLLSKMLDDATPQDSIGGPPQLIKISESMNTRPFVVKWKGNYTLFGRPLFPYENIDYWTVDPKTGKKEPPKFPGRQYSSEENDVDHE